MNRMWYISLSVSLFILSITAAQARIIHVPIDAATIQEGIDGAVDGDTVLVEPDTYLENINFNGHNIVLGSLLLTTGDTSYVSSTIISSSSWGPIVTFENGEDSTALIAGFSIQNGRAWQGGGIYCYNSSPSLTNIAVTGSEATLRGGGISCYWNSSPCLTYVSISENSAPDGGGIYCYYNSNPSLSDVVVHGNDADVGGGVYCYASNPTLSNVTISRNVADERGGGIMCNLSSPTLERTTISGNSSPLGGGMCCGNSGPTLVNTVVEGNTGTYGGVLFYDSPNAHITYGDFHNNENCDFFGVGPHALGTISTVNANGDSCDVYFNIFLDPLFINPAGGDYHLQAGSPCIDAGDPNSPLDPDSTVADIGAFYYHQTGVWEDRWEFRPSSLRLLSSFPNPVEDRVTIEYEMPETGRMQIVIYSLLGQPTRTLVNECQSAGRHTVIWDGRDDSGRYVPGGIYFLRLSGKPGDLGIRTRESVWTGPGVRAETVTRKLIVIR